MPILLLIPLMLLGLMVLELWLLFQLSDALGFFRTLALVIGAGILGAWVARWQGFQALSKLQREMQQGIVPGKTIGNGVLILIAAGLLILPGIISDALGLLLLIPPVRTLILMALRHGFATRVHMQGHATWQGTQFPGDDTVRGSSTVVDARVIEAHVVDDEN